METVNLLNVKFSRNKGKLKHLALLNVWGFDKTNGEV